MSSSAQRSVGLRLADILQYAGEARSMLKGVSLDAYLKDTVRRLAVERCIEIVSEASRHIPSELKELENAIPWQKVANIGNVLRHAYQSIEDPLIYNIVKDELPLVEAAVGRLLPFASE